MHKSAATLPRLTICAFLVTVSSLLAQTSGGLDATFGSAGTVLIPVPGYSITGRAVALAPDGKIVLAGTATNATESPANRFVVARLNVDGSLDTSFASEGIKVYVPKQVDPIAESFGRCVLVLDDGSILVGGHSGNQFLLSKLGSDGQEAAVFDGVHPVQGNTNGVGVSVEVNAMTLDRRATPNRVMLAGSAFVYGQKSPSTQEVTEITDGVKHPWIQEFDLAGIATPDPVLTTINEGAAAPAADEITACVSSRDGTAILAGMSSGHRWLFTKGSMTEQAPPTLGTDFANEVHAVGTSGDADFRVAFGGSGTSLPGIRVGRARPLAGNNYFGPMLPAQVTEASAPTPSGNKCVSVYERPDGRIVIAANDAMGGVSVFRLTSRGMTDHNFGESGQLTTSVEGALVAARAAAVQPQDERLLVVGDSIAVTANEAALMVTRFDLGNQVAPATPETPQIRTFPWTTSSPLDVNDGYPLNLRISVTCADPVRFAWNPPPSTSPTVVTHNGNQSECLMDRILYDWNWRIRGDVEVSSEAGSVFQSWSINISARLEVRYHSPQIWPKGVTNFYPQGYVLLLGYNDRMLGQGNVWWVGPPIRVGATGNVYWAGGMAVYPLSYDGPLHFEHVSVSVIKAPTDPYAIGPASKLFAIGSAGRVELDDIASSTGTYTEIWQKNGKTLRDAAGNPTLPVFKSVTLEDAGTYRSIIRNSRGSYTTPSILVGVVDTTNSRQVYGAIGKPVSIPAPVAGSGLTYQWLLNGKELVNSTHIAGAKSKTLTIRKVESGDVGIYACHVSNSDGGWGLTSAQTTLRLVDSVPIFDSFALPDGALLDSYSFDLRTHASIGTTKFRVSGLPRGLVVDAATGILSGAPALAGNFTVRVLASNPAGTADPLLLPLHIEGLPSGAAGSFTGVQTSQRLLANVTIAESGAYTAAVQMYWGRPIRKTFRGYMNRTGSLLSLDAKITAPTEYAAVGVPDFDLAFRLSGGELTLNTDYPMHKLVWNSRTLPATTFEGYYTAKYGSSDVDGFAGITISSSGRVTVQNRMLDGLSYVGSTIVSSSGIIPMFQWKPGRMGVVVGNLSIVPGPSIGSYAASVAGQVDWSYAKGTTFQLGPIWGGEKTLAVLGSRYLPPDVPSESGPLMFDLPDHSSNLRASWVDPATNAAGSQTGTLSNSNRIDWEISGFADGATRFGAVRFAPKTGLFSGSARLSVPNLVSIGDYSTSISFLGMTVRTEASSATATGQGLYIRSLRRLESDSKGQLVSRPAKAYGRVVLETNAH